MSYTYFVHRKTAPNFVVEINKHVFNHFKRRQRVLGIFVFVSMTVLLLQIYMISPFRTGSFTRTDSNPKTTGASNEPFERLREARHILSNDDSEEMFMFPKRKFILHGNCSSLLQNKSASNMYTLYSNMTTQEVGDTYSDEELTNATHDCLSYRRNRGYVLHHLSQKEKEFPIAYSITMYKDPGQVERLLRAIYRPQNLYCIHVDRKSPAFVHTTMATLAGCFDNVFMASQQLIVRWGKMSVLEAGLICLQDLLHRHKTWKYYINLTGQDFPMKTNAEIVESLKQRDGQNDVERSRFYNYNRWLKAGPAPQGITPIKGATHVAITRKFAEFCLHDTRAHSFILWLTKTSVPDESFFSTLNYNPQLEAPGYFKGDQEGKIHLSVKLVNWFGQEFKCKGNNVHGICIYGVGDLPVLAKRPELFVNKVYWNFQPVTLECLDEWVFNKSTLSYDSSHKKSY